MEDWPMARQFRDAQCHPIWEGTENIICLDVRRAMRSEGAHEALLARIERSLDAAGPHEPLARPAEAVASTLKEAREAIAHLEGVDDDIQLLQGRRLANLLGDLSEGAVLLDEAAWALARDGDARKAVVARRFARSHLETLPVRGIVDDDRTVLDLFDPLVRYGRVEAAQVA
jgi:acyl-CoA dehydrogenase-like protein